MVTAMTVRSRLALLAVAALTAVPGVVAIGGNVSDGSMGGRTLVAVTDVPDALAATPVRSHPVPLALRGLPVAPGAAVAVASVLGRGGAHPVLPRELRLNDVGDRWRALLLGAPPTLL
jgi:hypothetical protein